MQDQDTQIKDERKKMQLEVLLKDSDVKKNMRSRIEIETALRDLKHKDNLIQAEIASKENLLKKIEAEYMQLQNELIKLKHQMNSLGR
jgi:chromosome segregation ATPase